MEGKYTRLTEAPLPKRRYGARANDRTTHTDMATGRLVLRATSPYSRATWQHLWREERAGSMPGKIPQIISELEGAAPVIAGLVEEGERQAEIERALLEAELREHAREEAAQRRVDAIEESTTDLSAIIEKWGAAKRIDEFFADAERRALTLAEEDRARVLDRLRRARELVGSVDALDRFRSWKAPDERD